MKILLSDIHKQIQIPSKCVETLCLFTPQLSSWAHDATTEPSTPRSSLPAGPLTDNLDLIDWDLRRATSLSKDDISGESVYFYIQRDFPAFIFTML